MGDSITELVKGFDGLPVIAHLQHMHAEHVRRDTCLIELLAEAHYGVEKVLVVSWWVSSVRSVFNVVSTRGDAPAMPSVMMSTLTGFGVRVS